MQAGSDPSSAPGPPTRSPPIVPIDAAAVLESMGDAFYALDGEWRFTYANGRALDFWKVRAEDLIGRAIWDAFPSMRGTYNEVALCEVATSRRPLMFEGPSPTTGRSVSVTISPIRPAGVAIYFRDISERTRAEERLRQSEEHLRLAQEAGGIGTWERSLTGDEMHGSEQMFRLLGREPELGRNLLPLLRQAIHPQDRRPALAAADAFRQRPGPLRLEFRILRPDRAIRYLVFIGRVVAREDGTPQRMLGVCLDSTARREGEEAIRASAERLRLAMKAGGLATWEINVTTGLRESPEAAIMHGFPPGQTRMPRRDWASYIHPDDHKRVLETFEQALTSGQDYGCEYRILHRDGAVRWTASSGSVLRDEHGAPVRVVGVIQDVTDRRRDEERLRELNRALEVRVGEEVAARESAQARAAHAERMQALGQLAGGIAHDFNNVLQAIQGGATLIERRPDDPARVRRFARMVLDAVSRGAAITGRLLTFGRRSHLRAEAVNASELLESLREILGHALGPVISVAVCAAPDLPALFADRGQLETSLVNLATNARDAMPEGGTLMLVAAVADVDEAPGNPNGLRAGNYVRLEVIDTGIGMDAATLARASEPFFTTKPLGKGTGLGLAMARGFAEQSGGGFAIMSKPGQGTTVQLWFPVASHEFPNDEKEGSAVPKETGEEPQILVLGEESLAQGLAERGFEVSVAANGAAAARALEAGLPIRALVADLSLQGNVFSVVRAAQAQRPGLPALLLTGHEGDAISLVASGSLPGSFSVMRKPVAPLHLADRLAAILEAADKAEA